MPFDGEANGSGLLAAGNFICCEGFVSTIFVCLRSSSCGSTGATGSAGCEGGRRVGGGAGVPNKAVLNALTAKRCAGVPGWSSPKERSLSFDHQLIVVPVFQVHKHTIVRRLFWLQASRY